MKIVEIWQAVVENLQFCRSTSNILTNALNPYLEPTIWSAATNEQAPDEDRTNLAEKI